MATTQKRARIGGETGTNGEFYEGGKFLPSTERPKGKPVKKKPRKVNVEPYVWVTLEPGDNRKPILSIVGTGAAYIDRYDWRKGIKPYMPAFQNGVMCNGETLENVAALCERFNAGERWFTR